MTALSIIAVLIVVGAWAVIRWSEESQRIERDLTTYLVTIPASEWAEDEQ